MTDCATSKIVAREGSSSPSAGLSAHAEDVASPAATVAAAAEEERFAEAPPFIQWLLVVYAFNSTGEPESVGLGLLLELVAPKVSSRCCHSDIVALMGLLTDEGTLIS